MSGLEVVIAGQPQRIAWAEIDGLYFRNELVKTVGIQARIEGRLRSAFPAANMWMEQYIAQTKGRAVNVSQFKAAGLDKAFGRDLLNQSFAVEEVHPEKLPLSQMGLTEFRAFERMPIRGITYNNTFFVQRGELTPSLAFHELVHVVQWAEAGPEGFLMAYGLGLMAWGYDACPLEAMAYSLEAAFNSHDLPADTESYIKQQTRLILAKPFEHPAPAL